MIEDLPVLPILLLSVIVHEISHGWMALSLGDPTAKMQGRLTLNPIPHIDPVGSILVPLMSIAATGHVLIAWAKPVPVDRSNFAHPRRDDVLVSAVGPFSNLVMAFVCAAGAVGVGLLGRAVNDGAPAIVMETTRFLFTMLYGGMYINVVLAVFNILPVPPLDGSHVLAAALPPRAAMSYQRIGFLGVLVLLLAMRVQAVNEAFFGAIGLTFAPFRALVDMFL